jgi:hypothetical protein
LPTASTNTGTLNPNRCSNPTTERTSPKPAELDIVAMSAAAVLEDED